MTGDTIELVFDPVIEKERFLCPHCDQRLPVDPVTECDQCGAHLRIDVVTEAPPVGYD